MPLDTPRTEPQPERLTAHEARQRLEHARNTRLTQLQAIGDTAHTPDDHLMSSQKDAIRRALTEIDEALARVGNGTYGSCLACSTTIPAERLEILPYTRHCVACQRRAM
ncbi:TraR/DksA family transcriptional regulator [Streptomyces wuyuanensis]|uniref:RNA polymerase-binding transcription factor DksA n=1 Tax=Streptomyces wuyuanensis TaxID=1196353 RepID=A0A1G9U001_9ACTN|nr:TraR/DksA C4-type zinc finger protein [Streptomyces wuyuanensis]SDM52974.1 RNA polymerase-binding transcription factor DksA [Streptomyces wuyuanensis]